MYVRMMRLLSVPRAPSHASERILDVRSRNCSVVSDELGEFDESREEASELSSVGEVTSSAITATDRVSVDATDQPRSKTEM